MPFMWSDFRTFFKIHNNSDSLRRLFLSICCSSLCLCLFKHTGNGWISQHVWRALVSIHVDRASVVITLPRSVTSVQDSCFSMSAWCAALSGDWHHIAPLSNCSSQGLIYFHFHKLKPDCKDWREGYIAGGGLTHRYSIWKMMATHIFLQCGHLARVLNRSSIHCKKKEGS